MIDVEMWIRILEQGDLYAIPEPLATFRLATNSWSSELVGRQREQAAGLFKQVQQRRPDLVTPIDVRIGSTQAYALSQARRGLYWWLARKR